MLVTEPQPVTLRTDRPGGTTQTNLTNATKQGDTLFTGTPGATPQGTEVKQGFLEGSGADPARSMVDMIVSMRAYEATQRVIHAIDDTLGKGIQSAGGS